MNQLMWIGAAALMTVGIASPAHAIVDLAPDSFDSPSVSQCVLLTCATAHADVVVEDPCLLCPTFTVGTCAYHGMSFAGPGNAQGTQTGNFVIPRCNSACIWDGDEANGCGDSGAQALKGALCTSFIQQTTRATGLLGTAEITESASAAEEEECVKQALALVQSADVPTLPPPDLEALPQRPDLPQPPQGVPELPIPPWLEG